MEYIEAKSILQYSQYKDKWFGIDYNMNLYRGCPHGCIYCDSRSDCYYVDNFDKVRIKENCIGILENELSKKRKTGVIGIGSMSDAYNPFEAKYNVTKSALELIDKYGFGVSIDTKSDLITRDIELFKRINKKSPVILKVTVTTADDNLSKIIEPNVCVSSKRFEAIKKLSEAGLFVGILLTPIIPYITDTEENILAIVKEAVKCGAKFVYALEGVTLRENQREYFYEQLDKKFPSLKQKYISTYKNGYMCSTRDKDLMYKLYSSCKENHILYKMQDIIDTYKYEKDNTQNEQVSFFR